LLTFEGHTGSGRYMKFLSEDRISGSDDGEIRICFNKAIQAHSGKIREI